MEQKQNSLKNTTENNEQETADNKKIWIAPELRVLPVPAITQTGKRSQKTAEVNASYFKS